MGRQRIAGAALFVIALGLAACAGRFGSPGLPPAAVQRGGLQSRGAVPQAISDPTGTQPPAAWCGVTATPAPAAAVARRGRASPASSTAGGITISCILDSAQESSATVSVLADPTDNGGPDPGGADSCGPITWATSPPDGNVTVSVSDIDTGGSSCKRSDSVTIKVQRIANRPQPSPPPGTSVGGPYSLTGTDQETGSENLTEQMVPISINVYSAPALQISDEDIVGASNVVSSPNPTPSALMVGQQMRLLAAPVGGTVQGSVTWGLVIASPTPDVVASYGASPCPTGKCSPVPSAQPVTQGSTANPLVLYWLSSAPSKHVWATANIQMSVGPAFARRADVYYPIDTLMLNATTQALATPYIETGPGTEVPQVCASGEECIWGGYPAASWTFTATAPKEGAGQIAVAQILKQSLGSETLSGYTTKCTSTTSSLNAEQYWLDNGFPYPAATPAAIGSSGKATWTSNDAPYKRDTIANVGGAWRTAYFEDYFMYSPTATLQRPSIWVTLGFSSWNFSDSWGKLPIPPYNYEISEGHGGSPVVPRSGVNGTSPEASYVLPTWPKVDLNSPDPKPICT